MTASRIGLTLGKFAPLHQGHQFLIETALAEVDRLIVVIYDSPEVTTVPLTVRANWIRQLYPMVEVLEAWDGPNQVGDTAEIKGLQERYILGLLAHHQIGAISHFYSSEFYGEHMSQALGAQNRVVDQARIQVPVSATRIRNDPYQQRAFLDQVVYRDLITKVVFVGAPSTGKTTLAAQLAEQYHTCWMPEYGREYWEAHQHERRLTPAQLVEIAEGHLLREERLLPEANRYLFCDTNAITTYMFALDYHGSAEARLITLAEHATRRYDLVFLCGDDIPYDNTWDRSGAVHRQIFQKKITADLLARQIPFITLHGSLEQRTLQVTQILARYQKYRSLADYLFQKDHQEAQQ
jgi:NadR type nicotinamide-nucleotide adenylyltransferase